MTSLFDNAEIGIPCEKCNRITKKTIEWIKSNKKFSCVCGVTINVESEDLKSKIIEAEKSITGLKDTIKKIKI